MCLLLWWICRGKILEFSEQIEAFFALVHRKLADFKTPHNSNNIFLFPQCNNEFAQDSSKNSQIKRKLANKCTERKLQFWRTQIKKNTRFELSGDGRTPIILLQATEKTISAGEWTLMLINFPVWRCILRSLLSLPFMYMTAQQNINTSYRYFCMIEKTRHNSKKSAQKRCSNSAGTTAQTFLFQVTEWAWQKINASLWDECARPA